jgi:hypothetical protein
MRRIGYVVSTLLAGAALSACAASTDPATDVGSTTARLNAHGHTDSTPAHFEFQYARNAALLGTADQFTTPVRGPIPPHVPDVSFGEQVKALRPATSYAFRVCGGDGQIKPDVCGATVPFSTPAGAPAVDFTLSNPFGPPGAADSVAVGDFNRDGSLDLAVVGAGLPQCCPSGPILILLGDGHGGFAPPTNVSLPAGFNKSAVAPMVAGDFNLDGKLDLVVGGQGSLELLSGDGTGRFTAVRQVPVDGTVTQLVARDVNRDGKTDLVALVQNHVVVLLGDGSGNFTTSADIDAAENPVKLAVADVNHDGKTDLLAVTRTSPGVSILLGDGTGGFGSPRHTNVPSGSPGDLVVADLNRDGNADVVATKNFATSFGAPSSSPGYFFAGDGQGNLAQPEVIPNAPVGALAVGDFNNDGRLDLAGETTYSSGPTLEPTSAAIRVLLGNGDGGFQTPNDFPYGPVQSPFAEVLLYQTIASDLFHDGKPSLVSVGTVETGSTPFIDVTVLRNTT